MKRLNDNIVFFIEKNIHGAWVVYGMDGVKQYYGYSKAEAKRRYLDEYKVIVNKEN